MADAADSALIPIRRISNYSYCPRLFYLQAVERIFVESSDTVEGQIVHDRVDVPTEVKPDEDQPRVLRSLALDAGKLGITGILDLCCETEHGIEIVEYKKGSAHRNADDERVVKEWDAVQVVAQSLLAEENGRHVSAAFVYYATDKRRVPVALTPERRADCLRIIEEAKNCASSGTLPPPLINSSKCDHCSAYPVCLPHESRIWRDEDIAPAPSSPKVEPLRPPMAENDRREVLVVQTAGAYVGLRGGKIQVRLKEEVVREIPLHQLRSVYLYGNIQISAQAVQCCLEELIPIAYFSRSGSFYGITQPLGTSGVLAKRGQYKTAESLASSLSIARRMIAAKIHNQRVLLLRNAEGVEDEITQLSVLKRRAAEAPDAEILRGIEGAAARAYFGAFSKMLKGSDVAEFDFNGRNRRPPKDPINALLSLGYSLLAKELTGICLAVGLDPFLGIFHRPRLGRPALALDLMEEFRPLVVDSVVISLINRGTLSKADFQFTARGVFLMENSRRTFWEAWFGRLDTEVKHPTFGYSMNYRRMFEIQTRQLWRIFCGEAGNYEGFITR